MNVLEDIQYSLSSQTKAKKRFWLVDAPRSRNSKAPTNQSILFEILKFTKSKQNAVTAAFEAVKSHVIPFYARWIQFSDKLPFYKIRNIINQFK